MWHLADKTMVPGDVRSRGNADMDLHGPDVRFDLKRTCKTRLGATQRGVPLT